MVVLNVYCSDLTQSEFCLLFTWLEVDLQMKIVSSIFSFGEGIQSVPGGERISVTFVMVESFPSPTLYWIETYEGDVQPLKTE